MWVLTGYEPLEINLAGKHIIRCSASNAATASAQCFFLQYDEAPDNAVVEDDADTYVDSLNGQAV